MRQSVGRNTCEVAVIGAGPYGLAVAAHLKRANIETMVFGEALSFWQKNMPRGMKLRSPWQATHIAGIEGLSLDDFSGAKDMSRTDPVPLEKFVAYGTWFQSQAVPDLDTRRVKVVEHTTGGFRIRLDDDSVVTARRVVVALGLANQEHRPAEFGGVPEGLVTHACEHDDLSIFRGQHVAVIGRGQSATESAVLLREAGADVDLISHGPVNWLGIGGKTKSRLKAVLREMLTPPSAVGPFPLNWLAELPAVVHRMPEEMRAEYNRRSLRAGAAGWLQPRFTGIAERPGRTVTETRVSGKGVTVQMDTGTADYHHILLATGYKIDIGKLGILSRDLLAHIDAVNGSPRLGAGLESNVAGLHFVGAPAVASYGPLMRFIAGSPFAARTVTRAIKAAGEVKAPATVSVATAMPRQVANVGRGLNVPR